MSFKNIKKRNAFYSEVRDKQILSALLYELTAGKIRAPRHKLVPGPQRHCERSTPAKTPRQSYPVQYVLRSSVNKCGQNETARKRVGNDQGILYRRIYEAKRQPRWWQRQRLTLSKSKTKHNVLQINRIYTKPKGSKRPCKNHFTIHQSGTEAVVSHRHTAA